MKKCEHSSRDKGKSIFRIALLQRIVLLLFCIAMPALAYSQNKLIQGTVTDTQKESIIGASVTVKGTQKGTVTDIDGKFGIEASADDVLVITYIGFEKKEILVGNSTDILVILEEDRKVLDEVVVVGYAVQKKATLTGAISSIGTEELAMTKNQNVQNMLTGKIPGVRVIQKTSEPGEFNNQFDIRGFGSPLIVVDGVPRDNYQRLDPNEIESISVLKDASAAIYGVRAANGVVLITTKKGEKGKMKVDMSMYYGFQRPADLMKPVGAVDRMTLFNEKSMRNLTDPKLTYTMAEIEAYRTGQLQESDWYDAVLRDTAPQQQYNASFSGGSDRSDYFVNFGYTKQDGFFKSKSLNYEKFNLRSNLNAQVSDRLKLSLNLNAILDTKKRSNASIWEIYKTLWRSSPNDPIYANNNPLYLAKPPGDILNPVAMADSDIIGFYRGRKKIFQSNLQAVYDIPYIDGLKAKALFSYDNTIDDNSSYARQYNEYTYDEASNIYTPIAKNTPTKLERYYGNGYSMLWNISLEYTKKILDKHNVSAILLFEESKSVGDNIVASREFSINDFPYLFTGNTANQEGTSNPSGISEYVRQGLVGKLNYDFEGKYLLEFSFRYDGSSRFPKNSRWGFFPGGSLGWRLSEESFIKDNLSFVDNLKLRGSYGKMGDDGALEYQFLSGYDYPNTSGYRQQNYPTGYMFGGEYVNALGFRGAANPNITWYTVKTLNLGVDVDLWNGLFGFTFEAFQRKRDGLLATRLVSLPGSYGTKMPQENLNSDLTRGIELELRHRNKIQDFSYGANVNIAMTRTKREYVERAMAGNSYDNWRNNTNNRYNDVWFGWGSGGRYTSYDQIANSPIFTNNGTLPGDYIYEDWNGDGIIDEMDRYPIATTTDASQSDFQNKRNYPLMNFGLTLYAEYKGFDLNMLFQGSALSYVAYGDQLSTPLNWNGNALDLFMDRWRPEDPLKDPYDPSNKWISGYYSYGGTTPDMNSKFAIQNGSYLRLKSMELGYTIPKKIITKVGFWNTRIYFNAYNLLTITGVKGVDPERPTELYGYMYPLNKTINFGINITY